jgi:hypothetical protein
MNNTRQAEGQIGHLLSKSTPMIIPPTQGKSGGTDNDRP